MGTKSKIFLTAAISVVLTAAVTAKAVTYLNQNFSAFITDSGVSGKLNTINYVLKNQYLYDYDDAALSENAVQAYVEALDEPYTHYYTKDEFSAYLENVQDGYIGIGIVLTANDNNEIEVISTFEGSPAYQAGILPGDIITKADGKEYSGDNLTEMTAAIKSGEAGTAVKLVIRRGGEEKEYDIIRSDIQQKSVDGEMLDDGIGLIHISGFNSSADGSDYNTFTEFQAAVDELNEKGMKKLIIDLRDNPGGDLNIVCQIADMLLPEGIITYMEYKDGTRQDYSSDAEELNIPMAVLINQNSASASEVLTGALKDYEKAEIIGEKSYGKGIVQTVYPFADGSGMSMTVAKYYSPNGVCIHGIGIEPDISVSMPEEFSKYYASTVPHESDTQLQKAIEVLNSQ